jgi:hypothetical protein
MSVEEQEENCSSRAMSKDEALEQLRQEKKELKERVAQLETLVQK